MTGIVVDFQADIRDFLLAELQNMGFQTTGLTSFQDVAFQYERIRHRRVDARKRRTHVASGVVPPADHATGFAELIAASERGDSLLAYQSTLTTKAQINDGLLNHHFHMGVGPHPTAVGFKARTGPLVFALVARDDLYILKIGEHGAWTDRDFLEVLHKHWPEVIAPWKSVAQVSVAVSETDHKALRAAGINAAIVLSDGTCYFGPGGGLTTNMTGVAPKLNAIRLGRTIRGIEEHFLSCLGQLPQPRGNASQAGTRTHRLVITPRNGTLGWSIVDTRTGATQRIDLAVL